MPWALGLLVLIVAFVLILVAFVLSLRCGSTAAIEAWALPCRAPLLAIMPVMLSLLQAPKKSQDTPVRSLAATPRDLTICIHLIHLSASTCRQACSLQAMGEEPAFLVFVFILQTERILDLHLKRALLT